MYQELMHTIKLREITFVAKGVFFWGRVNVKSGKKLQTFRLVGSLCHFLFTKKYSTLYNITGNNVCCQEYSFLGRGNVKSR
jgi:hypothetical protein